MAGFRRRVAWLTFAAHSVRNMTLWCLIWGTGTLVLRLAFGLPVDIALWGVLGLPLGLGLGLRSSRRRGPDEPALRALFDRSFRAGGLWMAAERLELAAWQRHLEEARPESLPRPHWRATPSLWRLALAAAFALACFWLPQGSGGNRDPRALHIESSLQSLAEQVALLQDDGWLDETTAETLHHGVDALRREASGDNPAAAFETLDQLQEMTRWSAAGAAQASLEAAERLAATEAVVGALVEQTDGATSSGPQALLEMASWLDGSGDDPPRLGGALAEALRQAAAGGDVAAAGALKEALASSKEALQQRLERLQAAGLLDAASLQNLSQTLRSGEAGGDQALQAFLQQHPASASQELLAGKPRSGQAGPGGVDRGPGHVPLTVREAADFEAQLTPVVLPSGSLGDLTRSQTLAEAWTAPSSSEGASPSATAGLSVPSADGGGAWTHTLLPKHRRAVRDYFTPSVGDGSTSAEREDLE